MSMVDRDGNLMEGLPSNAIAVIGMGCRFPGANSVEEYWRLLEAGESMLSEPPEGRFPTHQHHRSTDKTVYSGNYLDDVASFDNKFFRKSSREAASMDPQQRLLLEVSYQTLESAGFFGPQEPDLDVGCFIGVCASDYNDNVASQPSNAFSALGTIRAFIPGRVSHFFGLTGPSIALDTACSSSAVAIDAACKAILFGDCKSAIAGGVSVFTSPFFFQNLAAASVLSPTGACKPFDVGADGYCRGEGVGLVVLKRLSKAIEDGDDILGTILATSVRQSSNKVSITVPCSRSQTELYRKLLDTAGIVADDVTYVEAHGTGTPVGDPVEFEAINEVFGVDSRRDPLYFSSVKGNIGHTEGASGVAGLIKTLLMMRNRTIPKQANFQSTHPRMILRPGICIPTKSIAWAANEMIACVNNYGAAGSIAGMIVKETPSNLSRNQSDQVGESLTKYPIIMAANTTSSLVSYGASLRDLISSNYTQFPANKNLLANLAFNLSNKQNQALPHLFATTVSNLSEFGGELSTLSSDPSWKVRQAPPQPTPIILVFGGQAARYVGLHKQVYETSTVLRKHLDECDEVLRKLGCRSIYPGIFESNRNTDVVSLHTMQFALQYASAQSWIACGLKVDCVLGHSFGQLVALTVADVLSLEHGIKLVHGRAVLIRDKWGPEKGSMVALEADYDDVMDIISMVKRTSGSPSFGLEVSCFNGPRSYVLVGSLADVELALDEVARKTTAAKIKVLDVTHGFHSRFCDPIIPDLERLAQSLTFNKPKIAIETCSEGMSWTTVTAKLITEHTRTPVYFEDAVKRIEARYGTCTWLEAGSNSSVISVVRRALSGQKSSMANLLCPVNLTRDDSMATLADMTVNLWTHGHHAQFWPFHRIHNEGYQAINLPPYRFERKRHWIDFGLAAESSLALSQRSEKPPEAEVNSVLIAFSGFRNFADTTHGHWKQALFTVNPRAEDWKSLVTGHSVLHESLCPASLYIELVQQAVSQLAALERIECAPFALIEDLEMPSPLGVSYDKIIQLILTPYDMHGRKFHFSFNAQDRSIGTGIPVSFDSSQPYSAHTTGKVEMVLLNDTAITAELERTRKLLQYMHRDHSKDESQRLTDLSMRQESEAMTGRLVYKLFSRVVQYQDFYKGVRKIASSNEGTVMAEVSLPGMQLSSTQGLLSMPVAIDNFLQVAGLYVNCLAPCPDCEVFICTHVSRIQLSPDFGKLQTNSERHNWDLFVISTAITEKESTNDVFATDKITGQLVFVAFGARFSRVRISSLAKVLSRANQDSEPAFGASNHGRYSATRKTLVSPANDGIGNPESDWLKPHTVPEVPQGTSAPPRVVLTDEHRPILSATPIPTHQIESVETRLRDMLSKMTDVPASQFKGDVALDGLGIDSLMATEIMSEVHKVFQISISQEHFQDLQTFASLCRYLDKNDNKDNQQKVGTENLTSPKISTICLSQQESLHYGSSEQRVYDNQVGQQISSAHLVSDGEYPGKYQYLTSRLAELLASHLECTASDFVRSTSLMDQGLDSLLCLELMTDIEEIFGVSIDLSVLASDSIFGQLVDMLATAVVSSDRGGASGSGTIDSTWSRSSALGTPVTAPTNGIDEVQALKTSLKTTPELSTTILADAAQEFEGIKRDFDKFAKEFEFDNFYGQVYEKQAHLVLAYVIEAFSDLGVDLHRMRPGDRIPHLKAVKRHSRMVNVLLEILRNGGVADYDGVQYVRSDELIRTVHSSILSRSIVAEFPQHASEHTLLHLCGADMSRFLSGQMNPLSVLFGNKANRNMLEDVYTTAPMFVVNTQLLTSFLEKALSKSVSGPDGKFHILELGAGTGATTRWVVERLMQKGIPIEYTFTDISFAFVSTGKRKFAKWSCMKYGTIDIEKEPPEEYQGKFDVVLATNCIHATASLRNSLQNIDKLLKPHGLVSLVEVTTRNYWPDIVFGFLDGWWLYDDGRPYVLGTPEFWDKSMRQAGFKHVSWTGGHTRESEVCRVITGFKQEVDDSKLYESIPQERTGGIETVVFAHTDKRLPLRADIHLPSSSQASAHKNWIAGLLIHGGGHVMLSRRDLRPRQIELLLDNGIFPVASDYRLCPETTLLEGPLVDVCDAYVWTKTVLPSLKLTKTNINMLLDGSKTVVVGWSTGGTLAMSLAWTSIPRGVSSPTAILAFYCPTDYEDDFWQKPNVPDHSKSLPINSYNVIEGVFEAPITAYNVPRKFLAAAGWIAPKDARSRVALHMNWHGQTLPVLFSGLPPASNVVPQRAAHYNDLDQPPLEDIVRASPYAQIIRGNYKTPTHVVFGTNDDLIPWQQAQRTMAALKDAGIESSITLAPDQPHLFDMYRDPDGSRWRYVMEGYRFLFAKIDRHLH